MKLKTIVALAALCVSGLANAEFVAFTESINTIGAFTWTSVTKAASQPFNMYGGVESHAYVLPVPFVPGGQVTFPALNLTNVTLHSTTGGSWSDNDPSNGFYFQNLAVGSYYLTVSGTSTLPGVFGAYYLTTAAAPAAVPEPESVALALAGLGFVGLTALRRRRAA
jgi:hypothetical protein